jgi:hypothetical protein
VQRDEEKWVGERAHVNARKAGTGERKAGHQIQGALGEENDEKFDDQYGRDRRKERSPTEGKIPVGPVRRDALVDSSPVQ